MHRQTRQYAQLNAQIHKQEQIRQNVEILHARVCMQMNKCAVIICRPKIIYRDFGTFTRAANRQMGCNPIEVAAELSLRGIYDHNRLGNRNTHDRARLKRLLLGSLFFPATITPSHYRRMSNRLMQSDSNNNH